MKQRKEIMAELARAKKPSAVLDYDAATEEQFTREDFEAALRKSGEN